MTDTKTDRRQTDRQTDGSDRITSALAEVIVDWQNAPDYRRGDWGVGVNTHLMEA